jgi:hypothetical protein
MPPFPMPLVRDLQVTFSQPLIPCNGSSIDAAVSSLWQPVEPISIPLLFTLFSFSCQIQITIHIASIAKIDINP